MRFLLVSVLFSLLLTNCPTENSQLVEMTASVSPEDAGEVNPPEGTYLPGKEITVETDAFEDQWEFTGWSGDTTASDDSLTFVITRDMNIVANYEIPTDAQPVLSMNVDPQNGGTIDPQGGTYELGDTVDVEATPAEGFQFVEWSGDTSATANPLTLVMDKNYDITANFVDKPKLTVTPEPTEGGTVVPTEGTFDFGTSVEIEATPAEGWEFVEWSGDTSATANPLTLVMDKNYDITANFVDKPKLTVTPEPTEGGTVDPAEGTFDFGTSVEVQATPAEGWEFVEWSGDTSATDNPIELTMDKNYDLTAQFEEKPTLTTLVQPPGGGTVSPSEGTFDIGSSVDVEATPADGWQFVGWRGDTLTTENPIALTMDKSYELTAVFVEDQELTVTTEPAEGGTVDPSEGTFDFGASVDVEATPSEGWEFVEWSGDTSSTSNPLALTMDKSYSLTANFDRLSAEFANQITVTDGSNSSDLTFGMNSEATAGFDDGLDRDLPPQPPQGSFYAQFNIPDYRLAEDYRPVNDETTWTLEFEPEGDRSITINWDFSDTDHVGNLTLTDPNNSSFEDIDMKSQTSYEVTGDINKLQIISSN